MQADLPSNKIKDIRGYKFGRLTVKEFSHIAPNKGKNAYWVCKCDCGNDKIISSKSLVTGSSQSCGCYARELSRVRVKSLHNTGKHLYFIRCGPYIKIGRTNNVELRLTQLRAANPYPVELVEKLENKGYLEKEFHEKYKDYNTTGEWFYLPEFTGSAN